MSWQILLAISVISSSVLVILQRIFLKHDKSDPIAYSIVFQILIGIIIGLFTLRRGFIFPDMRPIILNMFLIAVLYGIGNILTFKALKIIDASEYVIITAIKVLWIMVGAVMFLGESVSAKQILGTFLIIAAIVLIYWKKEKFVLSKGAGYALLASVFMGLAFTNDAYIIKSNFDLLTYLSVAFVIPGIAQLICFPKTISKIKFLFSKNMFWKMLVQSTVCAISALGIFYAYKLGNNAAQIAPLGQLSMVFVVLLGIIFLKEKKDLLKKIIGVVISFVGAMMVG